MSCSQLFVIGLNQCIDMMGMSESENKYVLIPCPEKTISKAFSGSDYSIYANNNYSNLWSNGYGSMGSCGVAQTQMSFTLNGLTPITYFNKHEIIIKQIFVNPCGLGSFFISTDNILYACGKNNDGQLGTLSNNHIYEPILVSDLKNKLIIDIKSCHFYSIAICLNNDPKFILIITNWSRLYSLPQDIKNLIISFMKATEVFATRAEAGTGHLRNAEIVNKNGWNMVNSFKDKNIVKCAVGSAHSMFLEENGVLWSCGLYATGRLGLSLNEDWSPGDAFFKPTKIPFFIKEKIVIKDIKCGCAHNIALDINGYVYSWGCNSYGQCGHGTDDGKNINEPKLIESAKEFVIDCIDCGYRHSYIKSTDGIHYLFGSNSYGECLTYNYEKHILSPFRVNQIIKTKCRTKEIIEIQLGYYNTKVIVTV